METLKSKCIHCGEIITEDNICPSYLKRECYICKSCSNKMKRDWVHRNKEKARVSARERMRRWRELNPERNAELSKQSANKRMVAGKFKEYSKRYHKINRKKNHAQFKAWKACVNGILKKEPCAICGTPNTEKHHPDYDKPLEVIWLCTKHHRRLHLWKN